MECAVMCAAVIGESQLRSETTVEPFGPSLWSQRTTNPKREMNDPLPDCHLLMQAKSTTSKRIYISTSIATGSPTPTVGAHVT